LPRGSVKRKSTNSISSAAILSNTVLISDIFAPF